MGALASLLFEVDIRAALREMGWDGMGLGEE